MSDKEGTEHSGIADSISSAKKSLSEAKNAITTLIDGISGWIERRSRLTQVVFAGGVSWGFREIMNSSRVTWETITSAVPIFTTPQLLMALIGIVVVQTTLQAREFKQIEYVVGQERMSTEARTDGGPARDDQGRFKKKSGGTSGGGALGGAVAGGAIGSSFGPAGTLFGILVGAILGDEIEKGGDS